MRVSLFQMAQGITTQPQAITTQAKKEMVPRENQHASTMSSRLMYFTRMNAPIFLGSKFDEDPQYFLDEAYKILFSIGECTT